MGQRKEEVSLFSHNWAKSVGSAHCSCVFEGRRSDLMPKRAYKCPSCRATSMFGEEWPGHAADCIDDFDLIELEMMAHRRFWKGAELNNVCLIVIFFCVVGTALVVMGVV